VVLDMDSTEIPVYGQQENSAYNGRLESRCSLPGHRWAGYKRDALRVWGPSGYRTSRPL